jgi:hypothetical protein
MSFRQLRMLNYAKCLKITLSSYFKFSKPEKIFSKKLKLRGISPLSHLRGAYPHPPLKDTLDWEYHWSDFDFVSEFMCVGGQRGTLLLLWCGSGAPAVREVIEG